MTIPELLAHVNERRAKQVELKWNAATENGEFVDRLVGHLSRLYAAVAEMHSQKGDDKCWMDTAAVYAAAGLPDPDKRVGDKAAMLKNCERYVALQCEGGGPWPTYAELEKELADAKDRIAALGNLIGSLHLYLGRYAVTQLTTEQKKLYHSLTGDTYAAELLKVTNE